MQIYTEVGKTGILILKQVRRVFNLADWMPGRVPAWDPVSQIVTHYLTYSSLEITV